MNKRKLNLIIGALLHDIGKVIYRGEATKNHSIAGYEFLKENTDIVDSDILEQVRYHHANFLKSAKIPDNSLAYITYIADNIASAADRKKNEDEEYGYDMYKPLSSVFNILNGNNEKKMYRPTVLNDEINNPVESASYSKEFYSQVTNNLLDCLRNYENKPEYINSLLEIFEANCTFIPSSTDKTQLADISLYDHLKLTAAVASCIYDYLENTENYKENLLKGNFYEKKAFLVYSIDISGIQNFIYTISTKFALKGLRARSFYLEIVMEHMLDTLLQRLELSRANIIYSGGGHGFMILPNTEKCKEIIKCFEIEINEWLLKNFDVALYVSGGYSEASANDLKNEPRGSYKQIFTNISEEISTRKSNRYNCEQILNLNYSKKETGKRECNICRRSEQINENNMCPLCHSLIKLSKDIVNKEFFSIIEGEADESSLMLPFGCHMVLDNRQELLDRMKNDGLIRCYCKNQQYLGYNVSTKLWVGDYSKGGDFSELAKVDNGIERLCVMRADIDNLGQAFVSGFENDRVGDRYVSLSRTATFSRKLSIFFKYHINTILKKGKFNLLDNNTERNIVIVYSGGDDVFVVGGWSDVIEFSIDLHNALEEYTQGTLKLSAGIGIYPDKYPISAMARETGELEDNSKNRKDINGEIVKNAITLFDKGEQGERCKKDEKDEKDKKDLCFGWNEFINNVMNEKYKTVYNFFEQSEERGKAFLYNLLDYLRSVDSDIINIARYTYLLSRLAPAQSESDIKKERYNEFSKKMYEWMKNQTDRKELITALYLYVYTIREGNDK